MLIIKDGKLVDANVEHEWMFEFPGVNAVIVMMDGSVETRTNLTEIHNLYKPTFGKNKKKIAFESDIHGTGGTLDHDEIRTVIVVPVEDVKRGYYV